MPPLEILRHDILDYLSKNTRLLVKNQSYQVWLPPADGFHPSLVHQWIKQFRICFMTSTLILYFPDPYNKAYHPLIKNLEKSDRAIHKKGKKST